MLNKLLQEQIKQHLGRDYPVELTCLFESISDCYNEYQVTKESKEEIREGKDNDELLETLKNSINILKEDGDDLQSADNAQVLQVARLLKEETKNRRAAEKQKLQHTAHLNACQKIVHIGSWEVDALAKPNDPHFWSDETYRIMGYEPGSIPATYTTFFNAVHPDDRLPVIAKLEGYYKAREPYEVEHRLIAKDGTEKIVLSIGEVIVDEETKEPIKIFGSLQDITHRKKIENELKNAHYELKTLFQNMQEAFYSIDMNTNKVLQMSRACEDIYGYAAEEFIQNVDLLMDVILEEDKQLIYNNYPAMNAGESFKLEYRIFHKDGSMRWVEGRVNPTLENGKLVRLDGVTADITKRKMTELALKENELKFRTLIENGSDGIAVTDEKLNLTFVSNSMLRLTGNTPEEMLGRSVFGFFPQEDMETLNITSRSLFDSPGVPAAIKGKFPKKDGTYFFYEGFVTNLLNDPCIHGFVTNFHDVTERQNAEEALKASNEELKKTNTELDRFVYSVSHDLRAPLASILGAIGYAETETTDPDMLQNLALMKRSAQKLDGFIVDILNYSRNSRLEIKQEKVDFNDLLSDVKNNLKYMGSANNSVDIRINVNKSVPFYSDKSRISIVLNNLVSNGSRLV